MMMMKGGEGGGKSQWVVVSKNLLPLVLPVMKKDMVL